MKISRLCLLAASLAAVLTVTGCDDKKTATPAAQASAAKTYNIGVVQLVEHQALDAANKGFVDGLASKGFVEGKNVKFDFQNAQADQSNLRNIATRFTGNKVDLIGAIATPAAQTMANATNKIPIVATAVTDFEIAKLVKSNDKPGTNVTDMAPISSLLELIVKIYPNAKNVGVMYSSSEINSERQVQIFKEEAKKHNLNVREATVSNVNDIQQAAQSLVGKVFAGEGGEVKGGATAAIAIDYYELGKIAGTMAADILEGKAKPETMPIQYQKNFKTVFNGTAVKNLGLTIPADVKHELVK